LAAQQEGPCETLVLSARTNSCCQLNDILGEKRSSRNQAKQSKGFVPGNERSGEETRVPVGGEARNVSKTVSSRLMRKEFSERLERVYSKPVFWSRSYCLVSCGGAPLEIIKQYIENQKKPI
jgi:hypothetical protein